MSSLKTEIKPTKAASMPSGRSCPAPDAELFTAEERRILRSWLRNDAEPAVRRILAKWKLPGPPLFSSALDVAVAVVLERVQLRNPHLGATVVPVHHTDSRTIFTLDPRRRVQPSSIVPLSRHLFTLQWRDRREPDAFQPSTYSATPIPGTDMIVLAVSDDEDSSCPTANRVAIGWAPGADEFPESIGIVVRRHWSTLRDQANFRRWTRVGRAGLLGEDVLAEWASTVWP
jgi:hypothetical protein